MNDMSHPYYFKLIPTLKRLSTDLRESNYISVYDSYTINNAIEEINRLRNERDTARRMYCEHLHLFNNPHNQKESYKQTAIQLGWDCYSDTLSQEVSQERSTQ